MWFMKSTLASSGRLYYLDWLRVLAMIGIFFFHNARFFDVFSDWHVKNSSTGLAPSFLIAFMVQWIMPLFFLIAAAGTYYALKSRSAGQFVRERSLRLFVPLLFGMLVIVVPQAYFEAVSHGEQLGQYNLFQIYGLYLTTLPDLNWFHLWFLAYLFLFSIIALPLFISRKQGTSILSKIAARCNRPWLLLTLAVLSITAVNVLVYPDGFWGHKGSGGWNVLANLLFFIFGLLIFASPRVMESARKLRWFSLGAAVIASACLIGFFVDQLADSAAYFGSVNFILAHFVQAINTWLWLFAILGLAVRYLHKTTGFLTYANEAVLPFYVLHQTIIIVIGFYIVRWDSGIGLKYLVISTTSFIAIMAVYELLVRRVNVLRFLFGMRTSRKTRPGIAGVGER